MLWSHQQRRAAGDWRYANAAGAASGRDGPSSLRTGLASSAGSVLVGGGQHGYGDSERPAQYQKAL